MATGAATGVIGLKKGKSVVDTTSDAARRNRNRLAKDLKTKYEAGASIRDLMAETGRSYGSVHDLLEDAGTTFRTRGGNNWPKRKGALTEAERAKLAEYMLVKNGAGVSQRRLAAETGRSRKYVHTLIREAEVAMGKQDARTPGLLES